MAFAQDFHFKLGQHIICKVVEIVEAKDLIVSFQGQLLRVQNQSKRTFAVNHFVELEVMSLKPLRFAVVDAESANIKQMNLKRLSFRI